MHACVDLERLLRGQGGSIARVHLVVVGLIVDAEIAVMIFKGDGRLLDQFPVLVALICVLVDLAWHIPGLCQLLN